MGNRDNRYISGNSDPNPMLVMSASLLWRIPSFGSDPTSPEPVRNGYILGAKEKHIVIQPPTMGFVRPRPRRTLCKALMESGSSSRCIEIIRNTIGLCCYTIAEVLKEPCLPPGGDTTVLLHMSDFSRPHGTMNTLTVAGRCF